MSEKLIFELSSMGRRGYRLPACDVPEKDIAQLTPRRMLREKPADLPEVSEVDVVRHYVGLSVMNHHVDKGFYPLGSCTMKYNPKINEKIASFPEFQSAHPYTPSELVQGNMEILKKTEEVLE